MKQFFLLLILPALLFAQKPSLFPDATWLQDVHYAGTVYGGIPGGVITSVQAHLHGIEYMFHVKSDVEKARPLINDVHSLGKKYWVNLDGTVVEGNIQAILNDGQGITDSLFGAVMTLEGKQLILGPSAIRNINRPAWRNFLISCIKRAIDAGADGSQHDGAYFRPYDSFDDDDVAAFKSYVLSNSIATGDWNASTTTFRQYLLGKGKTDDNVFSNDADAANVRTLIGHWKRFKITQLKASWKAVKDSCSAYAASKNKSYTIALNCGSAIGEDAGTPYFVSDYAIGEFFGWGSLWPYTGELTVRTRLFESLGKRFVNWSPPTLDDVPLANPYDRYPSQIEKEAYMHLASQLYASGGVPQLTFPAYNTYPVFSFAQLNRNILNQVSPAGEIGVVLSHANMLLGDPRDIKGILLAMQDMNRSFNVIFFRSNLVGENDNLVLADLAKYKVIMLPEVYYLTNNQRSVLLNYVNNGGTVLTVRGVAYAGNYDENGAVQTNTTWKNLADVASTSIKTYGSGKFITIQHHILESNGYPPPSYGLAYINFKRSSVASDAVVASKIRDTVAKWIDYALPNKDVAGSGIPLTVRFFRFQDTLSSMFVYQVLNDSVRLPSREPISVGPLTVELAVTAGSVTKSFNADFHCIDDPGGVRIASAVTANQSSGRVTVTIPAFKRWGFVVLREVSQNPAAVAVARLRVNDSLLFRRIRSNTDVRLSWEVTAGVPKNVEVEVWTNIEMNGKPLIDVSALQNAVPGSTGKTSTLNSARRIIHQFVSAASLSYIIPSSSLHDSTVYLARVRAVSEANDTSAWIENFVYRNVPPRAPVTPTMYIQHQQTWYSSVNGDVFTPPDTSRRLIYGIFKGADHRGGYGGDWELDTLTYFVNIYTDSTTGGRGDTLKAVHRIGREINAILGPFNSSSAIDDLRDTVSFPLTAYENFGIYIRPVATDGYDTSRQGQWLAYYLDHHNDPPNPFPLIAPANNSSVSDVQPVVFKWIYKGDPDPFTKIGNAVSTVTIYFDSVNTFNSPGLKSYTKNADGNIRENDTIKVTLPPNFATVEKINQYKKLYWKAKIVDIDRAVEEGGGKGALGRESSEYFLLTVGSAPPQNPAVVLSAKSIQFGNAKVGRTKDTVLTISNTGTVNLIVSNVSSSNTAFSPKLAAFTVLPGQFMRDTIRFAPGKPGNESGRVIVTSNAPSSPDTITVTGYGAVYSATVSVKSIALGNIKIGTKKDTVITIRNIGNQQVAVSNVTVSSAVFTVSAKQFTVDTSKSMIDTISFTPVSTGSVTGKIVILSSASSSPDTVTITANGVLTGIRDDMGLPVTFSLSQNYPNPFNPSTTMLYGVPERSSVKISVYTMLGQRVDEISHSSVEAGYYEYLFDGTHLPSGVYVYRIEAVSEQNVKNVYRNVKKMMLMK